MLIIHTSTTSLINAFDLARKGPKHHVICGIYPEMTNMLTLPRDIIAWARTILPDWVQDEVTRILITADEYIFLVLSQEIRRGHIRPDQVRIIYHCDDGSLVELPFDADGEFTVRWPDGFFTERADLLFNS